MTIMQKLATKEFSSSTKVDAVVAAVQRMEESELFNAGRGAVFTHAGTNEMDASIMDGRPDGLRNYTGGAGGATGRW